jgi:hypothetical protein
MPIDSEMTEAVEQAARELGQPVVVARRLLKWLEELSDKELDAAGDNQHLVMLRSAIKTDDDKGKS